MCNCSDYTGSTRFSIFEFQSNGLENRDAQGWPSLCRWGRRKKDFPQKNMDKSKSQLLHWLPVTVEQYMVSNNDRYLTH